MFPFPLTQLTPQNTNNFKVQLDFKRIYRDMAIKRFAADKCMHWDKGIKLSKSRRQQINAIGVLPRLIAY